MALLEPTNLLLLACALIYGLSGDVQEAWILLGFVVAICLLDGWQQQRSRRALAKLARLSSPRARMCRDGIDIDMAAEEARLEDLLRLEEGDWVAADAQLREGVGL
jgi:Ca2+-transporting ATPase